MLDIKLTTAWFYQGLFETKIVGTRYYAGQATIGETVNVRRDVNNRYDSNAIRIESVMGGQIGHLGRDVAYKFAPFLVRYIVFLHHCI